MAFTFGRLCRPRVLAALIVAATFTTQAAAPGAAAKGDLAPFPSNQAASLPSVSADGRYVAYSAYGSNIAENDTNGVSDVFVLDRATGLQRRVSVATGGGQGDGDSRAPSISADGNFVAFESFATNLVAGDTNNRRDIFVRDIAAGTTVRANVAANGDQSNGDSRTPSISGNGRVVAFVSGSSSLVGGQIGISEVLVKDLSNGSILRAVEDDTVPNAVAQDFPVISDDGRYVAYSSSAANLVDSDDNFRADIFVFDVSARSLVRVSALGNTDGNSASLNPAISGDGRYVVFQTGATNLVPGDTNSAEDVLRWDRSGNSLTRISVAAGGAQASGRSFKPSISRDGNFVTFYSRAALVAEDANSADDVYLVGSGGPRLVTRTAAGSAAGIVEQAEAEFGRAAVANGGTTVAFNAWQSFVPGDYRGFGQVFAFDASDNSIDLVSSGRTGRVDDGSATQGTISGNGRLVAFTTQATNLVAGVDSAVGPDVYLRDLVAGTNTLVSRNGAGTAVNDAFTASISDDGSRIAFQSVTGGIDAGDGRQQIYVRDVATGNVQLASTTSTGARPAAECFGASQSADGRYLLFNCSGLAINVVPSDNNGVGDVFLRDLVAQTTTRVSVTTAGAEVNGQSNESSISADGRFIVFTSLATNVVTDDTNGASDVFVRDTATNTTTRVSVASGGGQANGFSSTSMFSNGFWAGRRVISDDGRFVVWVSSSTNLTGSIPQSVNNVFVTDRQTNQVELLTRGGGAGNHDGDVREPAISGDGRYVVFASNATNLVPGDTNRSYDIFLFDRTNSRLTRVSAADAGGQADGNSLSPTISRDGSTIMFRSDATNLVAGDDNATTDLFVVERATQRVTRVSQRSDGPAGSASSRRSPSTSANGRFTTLLGSAAAGGGPGAKAAFGDVDVPQLYDWTQNALTRLNDRVDGTPSNGTATSTSIASDAAAASFTSTATDLSSDTSGKANVYARVLVNGHVQLLSASVDGQVANNASGRSAAATAGGVTRVAFESDASNLAGTDSNGVQDVYVSTGIFTRTMFRASGDCGTNVQANGASGDPAISPSGRWVAFASVATNLVTGDTNNKGDVFVCDVESRATTKIAGSATPGTAARPALAEVDGAYVLAFESDDPALVSGVVDGNNGSDVFVLTQGGAPVLASRGLDGRAANAPSRNPAISADGRYVSFVSSATNIVANDDNFQPDVFVFDRSTNSVTRVNTATDGTQANDLSLRTSLGQADGATFAIWDSAALNLANQANDGTFDIFRKAIDNSAAPRRIGGSGGVPILDGHAGLWYDAATVGQGWVVSLSPPPAARITVAWYTYEPAPGTKPVFLFGSTDIVTADNTALVDMFAVDGTSFPPNFNAANVQRRPWGQLRIRFSDCNNGSFSWTPTLAGYTAGSANVTRLTATEGEPCALGAASAATPVATPKAVAPQAGSGGLWYNAAASGQGWVLSVAPPPAERYTITWYTMEPAPSTRPVWMIGSTNAPDANNALNFNLLVLDGTSFMPDFNAANLVQRQWGSLRLEFDSCNAGTISWTPTIAGYTAGSMPVTRLTATAGVPCL